MGALARQAYAALLLVLCPLATRSQDDTAGCQHLYCKHCGAVLMPCSRLHHVHTDLATAHFTEPWCGEDRPVQTLAHSVGALRLSVAGGPEALEASGSTFVGFRALRDLSAPLYPTQPPTACAPVKPLPTSALAVALRGGCTFYDKALFAQRAGAAGLLVVDTEDSPVAGFTMSGPEPEEGQVTIPVAIVGKEDGRPLLARLRRGEAPLATLEGYGRTVLTALEHPALITEPLPGLASPRQREHAWFAGHNFRLTKCRVCGGHLGYQFNRTAREQQQPRGGTKPQALAEDGGGEGGEMGGALDAPDPEGAGAAADAAGEPGPAVHEADAAAPAQNPGPGLARAPLVFHALLGADLADCARLRTMTRGMRVSPTL